MASGDTFTQWYNNVDGTNAMVVGDIMLYANGEGGYVNRYGANGEQFYASVETGDEEGAFASEAACQTDCGNRARNGQAPFPGTHLRCTEVCQTQIQAVPQLENQLTQLPEPAHAG